MDKIVTHIRTGPRAIDGCLGSFTVVCPLRRLSPEAVKLPTYIVK